MVHAVAGQGPSQVGQLREFRDELVSCALNDMIFVVRIKELVNP